MKTNEIRVGDKVRYNNTPADPAFAGMEGEVIEANNSYLAVQVTNTASSFKPGATVYPLLKNVDKIKPFSFKDIKLGDKVRRTETWDTGTTQIVEGVVDTLGTVGAYSPETLRLETLRLGLNTDDENPHVVLELLERAPEPHWTESAEVGTRYSVKSNASGRFDFLFTKLEGGNWEKLHLTAADTCTISGSRAKGFFEDHEYKLIK